MDKGAGIKITVVLQRWTTGSTGLWKGFGALLQNQVPPGDVIYRNTLSLCIHRMYMPGTRLRLFSVPLFTYI